jgi:hypothetical protein
MPTPETAPAPGLAETLFSLATSRLRMQEMRFRTFDFGAFSAMAADVVIAATVIYSGGTHQLMNVVLILVDISLILGALTLRLQGVWGVSSVLVEILQARETISDREAFQALLDRLGQDFEINKRILARKATLLTCAYTFTLLAVITDGVGKLV